MDSRTAPCKYEGIKALAESADKSSADLRLFLALTRGSREIDSEDGDSADTTEDEAAERDREVSAGLAGATENKEPVAGCGTEELDKFTTVAALNKLLAAGFAGGELNSDLGFPLGFSEEKTDVLAELRAGAANRELGRELDETLTAGLVLKRENILILCNRILNK